jgi:hypothetical protein
MYTFVLPFCYLICVIFLSSFPCCLLLMNGDDLTLDVHMQTSLLIEGWTLNEHFHYTLY